MTLEQACVFTKEIVIGKKLPCNIYGANSNSARVVVYISGLETAQQDEIITMGISRGFTMRRWKQEISFE